MRTGQPRRGLTLTNLVAVLTSLGVLAGLAVQSLPSAAERADQLRCQNNLRQLVLGVQNHHDQRGDLPPMAMFSGGISWAGALMPYMEQVNLWRRLRFDLPYDSVPNNDVRHLKGPGAAFPFFYCPARRKPPRYTDGYSVSDYAVPSVGVDATLDDPKLDDTWMQCHSLKKNHGPLLMLYESQPESWKEGESSDAARRYRSQTSLASLVDGTSNQIVFGEKALHTNLLGKDEKAGDFTVYAFVEKSYNASGAARPGNGGVSPSADANKETVYRYWGSWHSGLCQFAVADGRVRPFNTAGSAKVIAAMCDRRDGAKVEYPEDRDAKIDDGALVGDAK